MSDFLTGQVATSPNVLVQDLSGEAVLLNLDNGQYYGLDEVSFHMFNLLITSSTVQAAYEALLEEYEVEPEQLRLDLNKFLDHLLENGLVVRVGRKLE